MPDRRIHLQPRQAPRRYDPSAMQAVLDDLAAQTLFTAEKLERRIQADSAAPPGTHPPGTDISLSLSFDSAAGFQSLVATPAWTDIAWDRIDYPQKDPRVVAGPDRYTASERIPDPDVELEEGSTTTAIVRKAGWYEIEYGLAVINLGAAATFDLGEGQVRVDKADGAGFTAPTELLTFSRTLFSTGWDRDFLFCRRVLYLEPDWRLRLSARKAGGSLGNILWALERATHLTFYKRRD